MSAGPSFGLSLAEAGATLKEKRLQGFGANATQWYPVQGRFVELSK